jgi:hypothetical protein
MELEIERPQLTQYQKDILYCDAQITITEASTKAGKTFSHLWWIFEQAVEPPKVGANYYWVAPVYGQAEIAFGRLKRVLQGEPSFDINISKLRVTTPNGGVMQFKSAENPDNLYGDDVFGIVADEATRMKEDAFYAMRSTITKTRGKIKIIGNSKGKKNWVYKLGMRARSGEQNYKYFKITAWDAVDAGILEREEVEQAQRDLPENVFKELYLAEPQEDGSNPFGFDYIRKCVRPLSTAKAEYFGIDLAKSRDWTVIIGLDGNGNIAYFDRFQKDWEQTTNEVIRVVGQNRAMIDSTGVGDPIVERVVKECRNAEGFKYTSDSKQKLIEGLSVSLQRGEIGIIEGILQDELEAFEFVYSNRGVKYEAPTGMTDDCVNALALANRIKQFNPVIVVGNARKLQTTWRDVM